MPWTAKTTEQNANNNICSNSQSFSKTDMRFNLSSQDGSGKW